MQFVKYLVRNVLTNQWLLINGLIIQDCFNTQQTKWRESKLFEDKFSL